MSVTYGTCCRFLDRAAIVEPGAGEEAFGPWRLATVTQVEETKLVLAMVPIWACTLTFCMAAPRLSPRCNVSAPTRTCCCCFTDLEQFHCRRAELAHVPSVVAGEELAGR